MDFLEQNLVGYSYSTQTRWVNQRPHYWAIRKAREWQKAHLLSHNVHVVLLTDDRANFEKATQQHIHASTAKEYVEMMA